MTLRAAATTVTVGGAAAVAVFFSDRIAENSVAEQGGRVVDYTAALDARAARRHQPFRDEFIAELASISRRVGVDVTSKLKIGIIPSQIGASSASIPSPASTGTRFFPHTHAYLLLPESVLLNMSLSRLKAIHPSTAPDIDPNTSGSPISPEDRYTIAHELAHIKHEDSAVRAGAMFGSAVITAGVGPAAARTFKLPAKTGTLLSLWTVLPAFFCYKWLCREQERNADALAGESGYAQGGVGWWARHVSFMGGNRLRHNPAAQQVVLEWGPWRSHPLAAERLHQLGEIVAAKSSDSAPVNS
jgi:hypothetical protein